MGYCRRDLGLEPTGDLVHQAGCCLGAHADVKEAVHASEEVILRYVKGGANLLSTQTQPVTTGSSCSIMVRPSTLLRFWHSSLLAVKNFMMT